MPMFGRRACRGHRGMPLCSFAAQRADETGSVSGERERTGSWARETGLQEWTNAVRRCQACRTAKPKQRRRQDGDAKRGDSKGSRGSRGGEAGEAGKRVHSPEPVLLLNFASPTEGSGDIVAMLWRVRCGVYAARIDRRAPVNCCMRVSRRRPARMRNIRTQAATVNDDVRRAVLLGWKGGGWGRGMRE
ncbi:hypothetical protein K505DRAFT_109487 [Melanomma pulvis-pyrius CBS 109.77]|uniref:Uncharacterized protein n=1 Tax=Melanomma pulvis-pyrius CBS 109.77 TaxID=1314802 RepID=A0A6A6WWG6_9PLEO|nr:hypothetical protein K505DRAFT_109487 [Melanomma pulvis-pyrius CBS 109.77]